MNRAKSWTPFYFPKLTRKRARMNLKCILIDPPSMAVNISRMSGVKEATEQLACAPPIGLAYIAAVLRENGIEVKIIDAKSLNISHKEAAQMVEKESPDLVGVTVFTSQLRSALQMCQAVKEVCPATKVVVGGPHIHSEHEEVIRKDFVDFCVRLEGEMTMLELVDAVSNGMDLRGVRGITFKRGDEIIVNPDRPLIKDLDTLPFPARDLLPNHVYGGVKGLEEGENYTMVTASRGCPFRCHFCAIPQFWSTQRRRSAANVLNELEHICETYNVTFFMFTDEEFVLNRKWVAELCQGMVERGLNRTVAWACSARVDTVSQELLEEMKRANCEFIFYGIEFGNQRILDFAEKKTTLAQIHRAVDMTRKAGISPHGNFMLGYPTETKETIEDTIALARTLDIDDASFSIVMPFPGTQLYRYCKENDLLNTYDWEQYSYFNPEKGIIKLKDVTNEELMKLYKKAHGEFYFRRVKDRLKQELASMFG